MEPEKHERGDLEHDVRGQEELVPSLSETSQGSKVEQLIRHESAQTAQDKRVRKVRPCSFGSQHPVFSQDELPDDHADEVHQRHEAHHLADAAVEDVERFVRVAGQ